MRTTRLAATLLALTFLSAPVSAAPPPAHGGSASERVIGSDRTSVIRRVMVDPLDERVLIVSHRGHHRSHPENSIPAIEAAIDGGAHVVEIDVRRTRDGSFVLMHDNKGDRTTTGKGRIEDMTLAEIRELRLTHNVRPTAETVPTLDEVFDVARGRVLLNVDSKGIDIMEAAAVAERAGMLDHCVFKARHEKIDNAFISWLDANPDVYFMPICEGREALEAATERRDWPAIEVIVKSADESLWSAEAVADLRGRGVRPWINTLWDGRLAAGFGDERAVDDASVFRDVLRMGWGFVQTDTPTKLALVARAAGLDATPSSPIATHERPSGHPHGGKARFEAIVRAMWEATDPALLVVAHRGHHLSEPENSIGAIEAAAAIGAHGVELDIRRTRDGVYVLMHDATIDRTTTGKGKVSELTLADLESVRLMHGKYPTAYCVPTLAKAFEVARGKLIIDIDPKDVDLREVIELAEEMGMLRQVVFKDRWSSLSPEDRSWLASRSDVYFKPNVHSIEELEEALNHPWRAIDFQHWTPELVKRVETAGTRSWSGSIKDGRDELPGDRQVFAEGAAAVYDAYVARSYGFVHTDLPDELIARVRSLGADVRVAGPRSDASDRLAPVHSHNDYAGDDPLSEALKARVRSIEVDVFPRGDELMVAHDAHEIIPERTFRSMYLEPLAQRLRTYGSVFPDGPRDDDPLLLLVDFKQDGERSLELLAEATRDIAPFLARADDDDVIRGEIMIVVTGKEPRDAILARPERDIFIDGGLADLRPGGLDRIAAPIVSSRYRDSFGWNGDGKMPADQHDRLIELVRTAHAKGQAIRFWGAPDTPHCWRTLLDAGVDLINTDQPATCAAFVRNASSR
ncbi:MAG: hypothetical protein CMJ31_13935 [Phycisphaerae bacterium]|nr:hypothetical protein [Phycisphaerae bacterium]